MNIKYKLSKKIDARGYQELLVYVRGHRITSYGKTGIYISANFFNKAGLIDYDLLGRKRLETADVVYCRKSVKEFEELRNYLLDKLAGEAIQKDMLKNAIDEYRGKLTDSLIEEEVKGNIPTLAELSEQFITEKGYNKGVAKGFRVLIRAIMRFEVFTQKTTQKDFVFDVNTITKEDAQRFHKYLADEKALSKKYPQLFKSMLVTYYVSEKSGRNVIGNRGDNTIVKMMKSLKGFFTWLHKKDITKNNPFDGYEFKGQVYGDPIYISIKERKQIALAEMPSKHLETQRDIFVFHCLIGCRVSDLVTLKQEDISANGKDKFLEYVPQKTHKKNFKTVRVPLTKEALALIDKYKGIDRKKRLMPFISAQKYNDAIKEVFKCADVTREVKVRNSVTGDVESKPINEIASSHMARRTFVGNLYKAVKDPSIVAKMAGQVEGSKAFKRYRKIEDDSLIETVETAEMKALDNTNNQTKED